MARILALVFAVAVSVSSSAELPPISRREKALQGINACMRRNEVSSRECKHLNHDIETLIDLYKSGDKSVLTTLFQFTYLTDFYDEALLSDADSFLTAMTQLPPKEQRDVAAGIAGGMFRLHDGERFNAIRALLARIPESSHTKGVAEMSLKALETNNAALFVNYFPPKTFTGRAADFQVSWYSRDMYALGEKQLWPPPSSDETTFRFTLLGAFTGPKAVTLTVLPDGTGQARMIVVRDSRDDKGDYTVVASQEQVSEFLKHVDRSHFWDMPTESPHRGEDGADWILEGVQGGKYHLAVRWCPDMQRTPEDAAFADLGFLLFDLAGHKLSRCG